jgi:preprotein translocase subunit SecD
MTDAQARVKKGHPLARGPAGARGSRPAWTRLGVLGAVLVIMYSIMILTGTTTPRLGLDLRGGTSVILTPKSTEAGKKPDSGAINQAVDIIRQRVNGLGVAESEVQRAGNQIEISVPGKGRNDVVDLVGQTAELRFRQVYQQDTATPTTLPSATGSAAATPAATPATTPATSAKPSAPASAGPSGTATLAPSAAPSAAATHGDAVASGLLAQAAATTAPSAPVAALTPTAAPSAAVTASPSAGTATTGAATTGAATAAPTATPSGGAATAAAGSGAAPPAAITAAFASLTCSPSDVRSQSGATDKASDWTVACDRTGTIKYILEPAKVVGTDVKTASAGLASSGGTTNITTGEWVVNVTFTGSGQSKFTKLTENTIGQQVAIVLDGVVQSAPTTNERIAGDAQISGNFSQSDAQDLANVLRYGALPLAFEKSQAESISATLGRDSLNGGLLAGAIGLALVILYSFVYYRALGVVTIMSLGVAGLLVYASVVLLGSAVSFTLSLAGIAGLIVSVGITADSFVILFERVKDEVRAGRTARAGVERAWVPARRTILSADTVSFLAAAALYVLSVGSVRGFAFTLGMSTVIDLVVVFLFTKPVVTLLVHKPFFSSGRFSGLRVPREVASAPRTRLARRPPAEPGPGQPTPTAARPASPTAQRGRRS